MAELETTLMDRLEQKRVCEGYRYVDDTNVQDILHILKSFHPSIKFTFEVEEKNSLPFLDV